MTFPSSLPSFFPEGEAAGLDLGIRKQHGWWPPGARTVMKNNPYVVSVRVGRSQPWTPQLFSSLHSSACPGEPFRKQEKPGKHSQKGLPCWFVCKCKASRAVALRPGLSPSEKSSQTPSAAVLRQNSLFYQLGATCKCPHALSPTGKCLSQVTGGPRENRGSWLSSEQFSW